jgi:hypothetical protein
MSAKPQPPEAPEPSKGDEFLRMSIAANFLVALGRIIASVPDEEDISLSSFQFFCLVNGVSVMLKKDAEGML